MLDLLQSRPSPKVLSPPVVLTLALFWPLVLVAQEQDAGQAARSRSDAADAAAADPGTTWLVLRDGSRVEVRAGWKDEGRRVLFTHPNGDLASVRSALVDFEATAALAAAAASAAEDRADAVPEAEEVEVEPVLVLTHQGHYEERDGAEKDGPPAATTDEATETDAASGAEATEDSPPAPSPPTRPRRVEVVSWTQIKNPEELGVAVMGSLENKSRDTVRGLELTVVVLDEAGEVTDSAPAVLKQTLLSPGAKTNFRAAFPRLATVPAVEFEVRASP